MMMYTSDLQHLLGGGGCARAKPRQANTKRRDFIFQAAAARYGWC